MLPLNYYDDSNPIREDDANIQIIDEEFHDAVDNLDHSNIIKLQKEYANQLSNKQNNENNNNLIDESTHTLCDDNYHIGSSSLIAMESTQVQDVRNSNYHTLIETQTGDTPETHSRSDYDPLDGTVLRTETGDIAIANDARVISKDAVVFQQTQCSQNPDSLSKTESAGKCLHSVKQEKIYDKEAHKVGDVVNNQSTQSSQLPTTTANVVSNVLETSKQNEVINTTKVSPSASKSLEVNSSQNVVVLDVSIMPVTEKPIDNNLVKDNKQIDSKSELPCAIKMLELYMTQPQQLNDASDAESELHIIQSRRLSNQQDSYINVIEDIESDM